MKIELTVDITRGSARRLTVLGITLLVTGIAAVTMAAPTTFRSKQKLTADDLNRSFSDLQKQITALETKLNALPVPVITEWNKYQPSLTTDKGVVVSGQTTDAYYRRVGDSLEVVMWTAFLQKPSSGGRPWRWSLPPGLSIDQTRTFDAGIGIIGMGSAEVEGGPGSVLTLYAANSTTISGSGTGAISHSLTDTNPVPFDKDSSISLQFTVPIVGWGAVAN